MKQIRAGFGYGIGAYLIWGAFPLYFTLVAVVSPLEIVPWRVVTTFVVCAILVSLGRRWPDVRRILRTPPGCSAPSCSPRSSSTRTGSSSSSA